MNEIWAHGRIDEYRHRCRGGGRAPVEYVVKKRPHTGAPLQPKYYCSAACIVADRPLDERPGTILDKTDHPVPVPLPDTWAGLQQLLANLAAAR